MKWSEKVSTTTGNLIACWCYIRWQYGVWDKLLQAAFVISFVIGLVLLYKDYKGKKK